MEKIESRPLAEELEARKFLASEVREEIALGG
jgi:hypothetical protein